MRKQTEQMLRRTLVEKAASDLRRTATFIAEDNWQMAHRTLSDALGYLTDLSEGYVSSAVHTAIYPDEADRETDWQAVMHKKLGKVTA